MRFKDFRDSLIRNFIQIPLDAPCDQLFKKIKPKDQTLLYRIIHTFKKQFHFLKVTKEKNTSKTALYVSKRKFENKLHFNAKRVRLDYVLENASKFTI